MLFYNTKLKKYSQELRKNMTDAERLLWSKLRGKQLKGFQIYRQRIIDNYIVDFYCPKASLIIEIDGGQHYTDEGKRKDKIRDYDLRNQGFKVLRFSDKEIFENLREVVGKIFENL
jgi:very-short-patch-repair endonuclease